MDENQEVSQEPRFLGQEPVKNQIKIKKLESEAKVKSQAKFRARDLGQEPGTKKD